MRADVLAWVDTLSLGQADAAMATRYYDEIVQSWGTRPWLIQTTLQPITIGNPIIPFPPEAVTILNVIYGGSECLPEKLRGIQGIDPLWRSRVGAPIAFFDELEASQTIRLYPIPDTPSKPFLFLTGSPLGVDYPDNAVMLIHTEIRDTVLPWMELILAFRILTLEYLRASDHRDATMATICQQVGDLLESLAG